LRSILHLQGKDVASTTGKGWFDMLKPTMTKELAIDLKILQVRVCAFVSSVLPGAAHFRCRIVMR